MELFFTVYTVSVTKPYYSINILYTIVLIICNTCTYTNMILYYFKQYTYIIIISHIYIYIYMCVITLIHINKYNKYQIAITYL